jgi:purine-cytosine permease-like protein
MNNKNNDQSLTQIETHGVEQIPDHERTAGPTDLFRMIFGGANTFATAVLGSFPVLFGLSFQAGVWAIVLGVLLGALILAPMGLFGPINGTNNAVSSGAHFGVHGRIVGSFLSLLTAIAFFSLSVWSSGDALVGGAKRLIGLPETDLTLGLAYGLFAMLVLTVCIYGFRFMLWVNKIAVWARACCSCWASSPSPVLSTQLRRHRQPGPAGLLGGLHRRGAGGHEQPDFVRRVPRRLVALHPA